MPIRIEDRLAWMENRLRLKHPTYSAKAIQRLAATLLKLEDEGNENEEELDFNRRVLQEKLRDLEAEKHDKQLAKQLATEEKPEYRKQHQKRVEEKAHDPIINKLFPGPKPVCPSPVIPFTGINARDHLGQTQLHKAVFQNDLNKCVDLIEKKKISINIKDHKNNTAFMIAIREGHTKIANYIKSRA